MAILPPDTEAAIYYRNRYLSSADKIAKLQKEIDNLYDKILAAGIINIALVTVIAALMYIK